MPKADRSNSQAQSLKMSADTLIENPDWFPFVETWSEKTPRQMFDTLVSSPYGSGQLATLPKMSIRFTPADFKFSIPGRFMKAIPALVKDKVSYVVLTHDVDNADYRTMNALSEFYMEDIRLTSSKRHFMERYPMEMWDRDKKRIVEIAKSKAPDGTVGPYEVRNAVFEFTRESNPFRPTVALAVYSLLKARSILDMSAGWGDRLLGALAWARRSGGPIRYQGYDPFFDLQERYAAMIQDFAPEQDGSRFTVTVSPFEDAPVEENAFDLAFTSPPYFDFETYGQSQRSGSTREDQSTVRYPDLKTWLSKFLKPMMRKASQSLRIGGYLAMNIEGPFVHGLLEDPELFGTMPPRMEYLGIIGYHSDEPTDRFTHPTFVWRRVV